MIIKHKVLCYAKIQVVSCSERVAVWRQKMKTLRSGIQIAVINVHRWKKDYRIWLILAFTAVLLVNYMRPYVEYCLYSGNKMTFCLLQFIYKPSEASIYAPKMLLHIGFMLLLCDAPFLHETAPYMFLRSGRRARFIGEVLYVFWTALFYMLFITFVSSIMTLPVVTLENDWGNGITDYLYGNENLTSEQVVSMFPPKLQIPAGPIMFFYPFACELYTFLTGLGCMFILGLLLLLVSLVAGRVEFGLAVTGGIVLLDPILTWRAFPSRYYLEAFSPVCWTSIAHLNLLSPNYFISIPFVAVAETVSITVLLILIYIVNKKSTIEIKV